MRARRRERGVLLIDALVAMSFFGVVLGGWLALTNLKFRALGEADRRFRATQAASSAIAEMRDGWRSPGKFVVPGGAGLMGDAALGEPRPDGWRELTVTVRWTEPGMREETVRLTTLVKP